VAVVLTLVQTKQIRINVHKRNNTKHSKQKYTSLLYFSNSCTSLSFKTLNITLKHLKFAPTCFGLIWNHSQGVHGCTSLSHWIGMLIYICYKECRYVAVCQFIPSVCVCEYLFGRPDRYPHTHTHTENEMTYSHIPTLFITIANHRSNSVTWQSTAMDRLRMVSKETETCRANFKCFSVKF